MFTFEMKFLFFIFNFYYILQILIDGTDPNAKDDTGCPLPTLVYLAREKRPQYPNNFKAGAMNALVMNKLKQLHTKKHTT